MKGESFEGKEQVLIGMSIFMTIRCIDILVFLICYVSFIDINQGGGARFLRNFDNLGRGYEPKIQMGA